ncbi:MAG: hypothetical protein QXJ97_12390 [Desulfurococcaceae archaeon]
MNLANVKLTKQLGYIHLELSLEDALRFLKLLRKKKGVYEDIEDSIRILENFDAFYEYIRKKHKEYVAPRKNEVDMLAGRVTVDKIKLEVDKIKKVTIVFDKRVKIEEITEVLRDLGLEFEAF